MGDAGFQRKCFTRITKFKELGRTILFVSHDINTVRKLCDRALLLHKGELVADGKPAEVIARYEEIFSGSVAAVR